MAYNIRFAPRKSGCTHAWRAYLCTYCNHWHASKRAQYMDPISRKQRLFKRNKGKYDTTD